MICIQDKKECCGCGACIQICPKQCMELKIDKEGFWYPKVLIENCIQCNLCENVCPMKKNKNKDELCNTYVAYLDNMEIRLASSSGGIFSILALEIIENKGVVFGAAFDENFMVVHKKIENISGLADLRGSKYVQSNTLDTFQETKNILESGRLVLYTGTPCQIMGLKSFLGREYTNLYTIDILCHGVPSQKVWNNYLNWQKKRYKKNSIEKISFRDKVEGWNKSSISIKFDTVSKYVNNYKNDIFMQTFLGNVCLRPSCYSCKFKNIHRCSDISLGDAWGIREFYKDMDDDRGTSLIITHSLKGEKLWNAQKRHMIVKSISLDKILPPSAESRKSVIASKIRRIFMYLNYIFGSNVFYCWYILHFIKEVRNFIKKKEYKKRNNI